MPSIDTFETAFSGLPPFPDNVPTAPLPGLDLQHLLDGDEQESERLRDACTKLGFFYLDLRGARSASASGSVGLHIDSLGASDKDLQIPQQTDGDEFREAADELFKVSDEFYSLPVEEKTKYDLSEKGSYFGYKGYGKGFVDAQGTKDRSEYYNISKDDILGIRERLPQPDLLDSYRPLLSSFMTNAHSIVTLILSRLNHSLGLDESPTPVLPSLHRRDSVSGDQVRFVRAPPQPMDDRKLSIGAHTDFGSVTLLFNKLGGLQVYPPPEVTRDDGSPYNEWLYVKPLPGHCIVNLGDAMVKFTGGILKSATHRVVNPPGEEQGSLTRTSLVYFSRPEDDVLLKILKGQGSKLIDEVATAREARGDRDEEINARDWVNRRALGRRGVKGYDNKATGGTEVAGTRD